MSVVSGLLLKSEKKSAPLAIGYLVASLVEMLALLFVIPYAIIAMATGPDKVLSLPTWAWLVGALAYVGLILVYFKPQGDLANKLDRFAFALGLLGLAVYCELQWRLFSDWLQTFASILKG